MDDEERFLDDQSGHVETLDAGTDTCTSILPYVNAIANIL